LEKGLFAKPLTEYDSEKCPWYYRRMISPATNISKELLREFSDIVSVENVLNKPSEQAAYESDAYPLEKARPLCIVLPGNRDEVIGIVKACNRANIPFSPRGAGTGLAGGSLIPNGISIGLSRMTRILEVDLRNKRIIAEAGVVNVVLSDAVADSGYGFAPDPSSQGASTIGGNISNNAGGPHTLKYGVTVNHVLSVDLVLPNGELITIGDRTEDVNGYDLLSLVCGGEGTLGIVTQATVRLTAMPEAVQTMLAVFDSIADATAAVNSILGSGVVPAALEMMDREIIVAVEDAFHYGLPKDAEAVLILEVDGMSAGIERQMVTAMSACQSNGAREIRLAESATERTKLWSARKKAVGTLGRLSPGIVTQDGVIPRSKLPEVLEKIMQIGKTHRLRIANVFHAGDGNLHPVVLFDPDIAGELERVHQANREILNLCIASGGVITGEHGIGVEKRDFMASLFPPASIETMRSVRSAFNPTELCNPDKLLPSSHGCSFEFGGRSSGAAS
jgi:glycolate oxidase subunit GlcD